MEQAVPNSLSSVLETHRNMSPPVVTKLEAVEAVQQQIHQQRKIIDRCKGENHALREELTLRTKVLVRSVLVTC